MNLNIDPPSYTIDAVCPFCKKHFRKKETAHNRKYCTKVCTGKAATAKKKERDGVARRTPKMDIKANNDLLGVKW